MEELKMWSTILDISRSTLVDIYGPDSLDVPKNLVKPPELGLSAWVLSLDETLLEAGMTTASAKACDDIFKARGCALASQLEEDFEARWGGVDTNMDEYGLQSIRDGLCRMYTTAFKDGLDKMRQDLMTLVRQRRKDAVENEASECKTWDSKTNPRAKELLEDVFQKNQTPNAAEKREMASATGLTSKQITTWFSNRRQRSKALKPYDLEATPRRRKVTARKASSSSIDSMPSLSSSVSSSSSHQSWDADSAPIRQESPAEVDFAAFLKSISPTPPPMDQPMQDPDVPAYSNYPSIEMLQLESPSSQSDTTMRNWEAPLQLEIPSLANYLADIAPPLNLDTSAGTGPEFWEEIYRITRGAAGQQPLEQDDPFANITITPEADDWSTVFAGFDWVPATPGQCSLPY